MSVCFSVHTSQPVSLLKSGSGPADHWWGLGLCFSARQPGGADALVQGTHSRPGPESLRSVPQSHQGASRDQDCSPAHHQTWQLGTLGIRILGSRVLTVSVRNSHGHPRLSCAGQDLPGGA